MIRHRTRALVTLIEPGDELNDGLVVDTRTYDPGQRLMRTSYGNGVLTDFNYRTDNLVNTITTTSSGQQLDRFVYDYDENKNVTQETRGDAMAAFSWTAQGATNVGYDNENRLVGMKRGMKRGRGSILNQ